MQKNTEKRPWGSYCVIGQGEKFLIKEITVLPSSRLSLQYHNHRKEHWVILEGEAVVTKADRTITLKEGEHIDIEIKEIHCIENKTTSNLKVLEVQRGEILKEEDIVRISDIYGRTK